MLRHIAFVAVFATAAFVGTSVAAGPMAAGHTEEVRGSAFAQLGSKMRALAAPADVYVGDSLTTETGSRAAFRLGMDTTLRMGADASVRIDRFLVQSGGTISVGDGPVLVDKDPDTGARPVTLEGDFGLVVVHGTRVFIGPGPKGTGVFVAHGEVVVRSGGQSVTLRDGQGTDVAHRGAPPTPPRTWGEARVDAALASVD